MRAVLSLGIAICWHPAVCVVAIVSRLTAARLFSAWCRVQLRLLGVSVRLEDRSGLAASQPRVLALLNQSSLIEVLVWPVVMPPRSRIVVNVEMALLPLVGWAAAAAASVVIVRQWRAQALRGLRRAQELLGRGFSIGISVEGRRSPDGQLAPFKKGAVRLAQAAGVPLLPMVCHGAQERLPFGSLRVRPGEIRVVLHPPVPTDRAPQEVLDRLRALAESELVRRDV